MDALNIKALAKLLRDNGDKVLSSEFKLSLSGPLLRALNDSFSLIADQTESCLPQSFQVVKEDYSKSDVFRDLQLIHDFFQKTLVLYLTSLPGDDFTGVIDISKFRSIRQLEIEKVNIKQIRGIQQFRPQIQTLTCIRCLETVDDIITYCGGDNSNGFVWDELKVADFSYNNLKTVDCSLEFGQWLQNLNLSHNQLTSCEAIKWLPNLKVLNLSFNRLSNVPLFHTEASKRLQILILNNNFLNNLSGASRLDSLNELDLSYNCLLEHSLLLPISTLAALKYLNLQGNPLAHHRKHREATSNYLNENTTTVKFVLDLRQLNGKEKSLAGSYKNYHSMLTPRFSNNTKSSATSTPSKRSQTSTPASSVGSIQSFRLNNAEALPVRDNFGIGISVQNDKNRKTKVRTVEFPETASSTASNLIEGCCGQDSIISKSSSSKKLRNKIELIGNQDHLKTKKQIEDLREKFGSSWLQNRKAEKVSDVLGIQETIAERNELISNLLASMKVSPPSETVQSNNTTNDNIFNIERAKQDETGIAYGLSNNTASNKIDFQLESNSKLINVQEKPASPINYGSELESGYQSMVTSTPITSNNQSSCNVNKLPNIMDSSCDRSSGNTTYESTYNTSASSNDENITIYKSIQEEQLANSMENNNYHDIYAKTNTEESEISDAEDNEFNYIVYKKDSSEEIFLTVSDVSIKEKNSLTKRTITKWSLKILESCDRIKSNTLRINFDTIKVDKRERVYTVEENLCQQLEKVLRNILSKRQLSEMNQTIYRCISCSCSFSTENSNEYKRKNPVISCPDCKSKFVAEILNCPKDKNTINDEAPIDIKPPALSKIENPVTATLQNVATLSANNLPSQGTNASGEKSLIDESASRSNSSIGKGKWKLPSKQILCSAGSLNESSCSKISNSQSSFDSNQSVAGSSANDREIDYNLNATNRHYCDSDVEILSNPSQSSIEILDSYQNQSSRKTSEERRISRIPSLETIEDNCIKGSDELQDDEQDNLSTLVPSASAGLSEFLQNEIKQNSDIGAAKQVSDNLDKTITTPQVYLTESSSSGSVTDSICTAYEQTIAGNTENSNASKKENSFISTVLGGLFQSTNILMSRAQKSTDEEVNCDKFKYNFVNFNEIDHRLKLYFYQSKFIDPNEQFKWLVKGKIFNEYKEQYFEGIIVMSTTKIYLMEIVGPETLDIKKWLKQIFCTPVNRLASIQLLPFKSGFAWSVQGWGNFLLILQDIQRTENLLLYFANNPLPVSCQVIYQVSDIIMKKISTAVHNQKLEMFSVLNMGSISCDSDSNVILPASFFVTDNQLYLTTSNLLWLTYNNDIPIEIERTQQMSNLLEVDHEPLSNTFGISFWDETEEKCELWNCTFETKENAEICLLSIGNSWEKLFDVPITNKYLSKNLN